MNTIDEQIECVKKLLASLEEQKMEGAKPVEPELPKAWFPKMGYEYYAIDSAGDVSESTWYADETDVKRYQIGNVYKTREEGEFEIERRRVETELRRYIYEHGGGDGEFELNGNNYYIYCDSSLIAKNLDIDYCDCFNFGAIYSNSEEILRDAINEIGEDRIKKYYLRVKE